MCPIFQCNKKVDRIPVNCFAQVLGADGGTFQVKSLHDNRIHDIPKQVFEASFNRIK